MGRKDYIKESAADAATEATATVVRGAVKVIIFVAVIGLLLVGCVAMLG